MTSNLSLEELDEWDYMYADNRFCPGDLILVVKGTAKRSTGMVFKREENGSYLVMLDGRGGNLYNFDADFLRLDSYGSDN